MPQNLPARLLAGILVSLGCAYLGWTLGLGLFSIAYEILRSRALETPLEDKAILVWIRNGFWLLGLVGGAALFWRWHREGCETLLGFRRAIVLMLAGVGTTHLGYLAVNGASVETMVLVAFFSFVGGCLFIAFCYGGLRPLRPFGMRALIALAASFAALYASLAFDKAQVQRYDSVGRERILWVRVEFPQDTVRADPEQIAVTLRTATQSVKCFAIAWDSEHKEKRTFLPMRCDFSEPTPDRVLVITLPEQTPVEIKMPFARNPAPMHDYSAWQKSGALNFRYRVT